MSDVRCTRHPGARAAWRCRGCGAALCPGCAWLHRAGTAELVACTRCRGLADPITVHRRELRSFAARLPAALAFPVLPGPLLAVFAAGTVVALLSYGGVVGAILGYAIEWTFLFSILRQAAKGAKGYEPAELTEEGSDLVLPALRGFVGAGIVWIPAALHAWSSLAAGGAPAAVARDPVVWALVLAGVVYAPAALMHAATGGKTIEMLNPAYVGSFIVRLGPDYALAVAAVALLGAAGAVLWAASVLAATLPVPLVGRILRESIDLLATTAMARVLGVLLYVRGDALGFGPDADYLERVLPHAVPRGAEPVLAPGAAPAPGVATAALRRPP